MNQKTIYNSNYTNKKVTAANYLIEILFEKIAKREKKELPQKFWNHSDWSKQYKIQIIHANTLLKEFPISVIIAALNDQQCWKITSLGARFLLDPLLQREY